MINGDMELPAAEKKAQEEKAAATIAEILMI